MAETSNEQVKAVKNIVERTCRSSQFGMCIPRLRLCLLHSFLEADQRAWGHGSDLQVVRSNGAVKLYN